MGSSVLLCPSASPVSHGCNIPSDQQSLSLSSLCFSQTVRSLLHRVRQEIEFRKTERHYVREGAGEHGSRRTRRREGTRRERETWNTVPTLMGTRSHETNENMRLSSLLPFFGAGARVRERERERNSLPPQLLLYFILKGKNEK